MLGCVGRSATLFSARQLLSTTSIARPLSCSRRFQTTMSSPTKSQQWNLREKPYSEPVLGGDKSTFTLNTADVPALQDGQVLLKTLYLSNDPAQRAWISPLAQAERLYLPPVQVGEPMKSMGIARVVESRNPNVKSGALVTGNPGWTEYSIDNGANVSVIDPQPGLSDTHFLGALGLPGFTAYYALTQIVKATSKDAIVVSGAAGAVGSMVVQIAKKMIGCRKVWFRSFLFFVNSVHLTKRFIPGYRYCWYRREMPMGGKARSRHLRQLQILIIQTRANQGDRRLCRHLFW